MRCSDDSVVIGLVGPLPPPFGGMANQTRQLATLLEQEGVSVILVQVNPEYKPRWIGKMKGLRAIVRLFYYVVELWAVAGKVDVIHVMANSGWAWQLFAAPAIWVSWLRTTPVVVNYRGGNANAYFSDSIRWVRPTIAKADAVIVPSGFLKKVFSDFDLEADIVPNIVNIDHFKPVVSAGERPRQQPTIVMTRNLESIYDIATGLEAIKLLKHSIPNLRVYIAGSGPEEAALKERVKELGLADTVEFTGKLDPNGIAALYQQADAMLNPSMVDNTPNSILESLACGVPVVTTNVGGIPYLVEHDVNALLVPRGDARAMADQLKRLLEDRSLYHRLAANGLAYVNQFAWTSVREKWIGLYEQLVTS